MMTDTFVELGVTKLLVSGFLTKPGILSHQMPKNDGIGEKKKKMRFNSWSE
jgi:hypothetical protein